MLQSSGLVHARPRLATLLAVHAAALVLLLGTAKVAASLA
jgi:hypothetical protein